MFYQSCMKLIGDVYVLSIGTDRYQTLKVTGFVSRKHVKRLGWGIDDEIYGFSDGVQFVSKEGLTFRAIGPVRTAKKMNQKIAEVNREIRNMRVESSDIGGLDVEGVVAVGAMCLGFLL